MYKICIINVYFGKFPDNFNQWLNSVKCNPTVDFIIFTDQNINHVPENLKIIKLDLDGFSQLASEKLEIKVNIKKPYKCCDFKVVYGVIFEDYLNEYDFWGHCDLDLVFGDIRKFITDDILASNDKILPLGHLSLYRNTSKCNNYYKLSGSKIADFKEILTSDQHYAFDEWPGIYSIYKKNNLPMYDKRIFADISSIYKRFRLALNDTNYNEQVFFWEDGNIYRAYIDNDEVKINEYIYIHFKKRKLATVGKFSDNVKSFYITYDGFIEKESGVPSKDDIRKYNKFRGVLYESLEELKDKYKILYNSLSRRITS